MPKTAPLPPRMVLAPVEGPSSLRRLQPTNTGTRPSTPTPQVFPPSSGGRLFSRPHSRHFDGAARQLPPRGQSQRPARFPSARSALAIPPSATAQPPPISSPSARPPLPSSATLPQQPLPTAAHPSTGMLLLTPEVVLALKASPGSQRSHRCSCYYQGCHQRHQRGH